MSVSTTSRTRPVKLTEDHVRRAISRASFAVLSHVTPTGAPRSSGVVYTVSDGRIYVVVAKESWKARHIAADGLVAMTVPIRRGGPLALLFPIPPATVSFPAVATVQPGEVLATMPRLARTVPPERRSTCVVLEIRPTGHYVTYGLGSKPRASRKGVPARPESLEGALVPPEAGPR